MTSAYRILFAIELQHDYYTDKTCNDIVLVPSPETAALMSRYRLTAKQVLNRYYVLTATDAAGNAFVNINTQQFSFYLRVTNTAFAGITSIDAPQLRLKRFYFTNTGKPARKAETPAPAALYLSAPVAAYSQSAVYQPGDLVSNTKGNLFECLHQATEIKTDKKESWLPVPDNIPFASSTDLVFTAGSALNCVLCEPAAGITVAIMARDQAKGDFSVPVKQYTQQLSMPVQQYSVPLNNLSPGRYEVTVNEEVFPAYVSPEFARQQYIGVVEILPLEKGEDYALTDAGGQLKSPVFTLHFTNRKAYWKYTALNNGVKAIADKSGTYKFAQVKDDNGKPINTFVSATPVPVAEKALQLRISLADANGGEDPLAGNPDLLQPSALTLGNGAYYCNMLINY